MLKISMLKAYKYRLYPNVEQKTLLEKHFGACRFVYNLALETKEAAYKSNKKSSLSCYDLQKQLTDLKQGCEWLKEINSQSLQAALAHLDAAYQGFFKGRGEYPNFKKKLGCQSFQCPQKVKINFDTQILYLPKFREGVKVAVSRRFEGIIKTVTVSKTPTGKYFASVLVEDGKELPIKAPICTDTAVGIDLGIKTFAVLSDGTVFDNPKHLKNSLKRLKVLSKRVSRKKKGSQNRKKSVKKLALLHEKIANQRADFLHKTSTAITKRYDTIVIEDLAVENMVKNHKLAQAIGDCGWGTFRQMITYKTEWQGKNLKVIGRFAPSSKTCSVCGEINQELTLKDREWTCGGCHTLHDRDKNAADNILATAFVTAEHLEAHYA